MVSPAVTPLYTTVSTRCPPSSPLKLISHTCRCPMNLSCEIPVTSLLKKFSVTHQIQYRPSHWHWSPSFSHSCPEIGKSHLGAFAHPASPPQRSLLSLSTSFILNAPCLMDRFLMSSVRKLIPSEAFACILYSSKVFAWRLCIVTSRLVHYSLQ